MEIDVIYTDMDPTPTEAFFLVGDSESEDLEVEAVSGDFVYLKVTDLSDTDVECELCDSGTATCTYNMADVEVVGYIGPY